MPWLDCVQCEYLVYINLTAETTRTIDSAQESPSSGLLGSIGNPRF